MDDAAPEFEHIEPHLEADFPDEALEAAARTAPAECGAYTVIMCTGGLECPF